MSKKALDANLDFDGMAGDGVNRSGNRFAGNHSGEQMKENFGNKTFKGNASDSPLAVGPSVTKDPLKTTISTASQGHPTHAGGTSVRRPPNPDAIYVE